MKPPTRNDVGIFLDVVFGGRILETLVLSFGTTEWDRLNGRLYPVGSMYGIFPYIYHIFMPNVGKYPIHGSYGYGLYWFYESFSTIVSSIWFKYDDVCDFDLPHQTFASWNGEVVYCIYVM